VQDPSLNFKFCVDAAKAGPDLAAWMHAWVKVIGELYHINSERLSIWNEALPLTEQSSDFQVAMMYP
jgi:hypothetical protein